LLSLLEKAQMTERKRQISTLCFLLLITTCLSTNLRGQEDDRQALVLYGEAANLQNGGEFKVAAELWEQFCNKYPKNKRILKAQHYRGVCYLQLQQIDKARDAFAEVVKNLESEPDFPLAEEALLNLGWCQYSLGQNGQNAKAEYENAAKTLQQMVEKYPESKLADQAWYFLGESLYLGHKTKESIEAYQKVVQGFPESTVRSNAMYALGVAQQDVSAFADARKTFETFQAEFADSPLVNEIKLRIAETILQEAIALAATDKTEEAKTQFSAAEKAFAELAAIEGFDRADHALFQQAYCLLSQDDYAKAASLYAKLAETYPQSTYAQGAKLSAGKFFYKIEDDAQAEKWLDAAWQDPANQEAATEAAHWLARLLIKRRDFAKAAEVSGKQLATAAGPLLVDLKMDQADALYEQSGQREKSLELYQKIAADHADSPQVPQALYNAAYTSLDLKKYDQGLQLANQFLETFDNDALVNDVNYVKAECLIMTDKFAEAEAIYSKLVELPDHPDAQSWKVRYGMSQFMQKKYEPVIALLADKADGFANEGIKSEAQYLVGASCFFTKKYSDAITWLEKRLTSNPGSPQNDEVLLLLAQSQYQANQFDAALKSIERLKKDFAESSYVGRANYYHGQIATAKKDYATAISEYQKVVDADAGEFTPYALFGKAWALQKTGKPEEAQEAFSQLIEKFPEHPLLADALLGRGTCLRLAGNFDAASADLQAALKANPNMVDARTAQYELGLAQVGQKKYDDAIKNFTSLVDSGEKNDLSDDYLYQLAWAQKYAEHADQAAKRFGEIVEKYPDSPFAAEASFHVGEAAYMNEKFDDAIKAYQFAKEKGADEINEKATFKLGWSQFRKEKFTEAAAEFQQQVDKHPAGALFVDGNFMLGESKFQNSQYKESLEQFQKTMPLIEKAPQTAASIQLLTRLHGAKSANEQKQFDASTSFLGEVAEVFAKSEYLAEAWLELGRAQRGQKDDENAIKSFEKAAVESLGATGAQARCLVGEVLFGQKKHEEAIKNYKRVMYGYGGEQAGADTKKWQALSGYEAARCAMVRIKDETDAAKKKQLTDEAKSLFQYVIEKHASDKLAEQSKTELKTLEQLK
jgi:TolA-binding protein